MVRLTKRRFRKHRGGACEVIADFGTCGDRIAFNGKKFANLAADEKKFVVQVQDVFRKKYCLDIRQVVREVQADYRYYEIGKREGLDEIFYFGKYRDVFIQKERECLGTNSIEEKFREIQAELTPTAEERDFLIAIAYLIRFNLVVHPAQDLVLRRLDPKLREFYEHSSDFTHLSRRRTLQLDPAIDIEAKALLDYNPFDTGEREKVLTAEEIEEDDNAIDRIFSLRFASGRNTIGVELKEFEPTILTGLARKDFIREILDSDINSLKATTFLCILSTFTLQSISNGYDLEYVFEILKKFRGQESPVINENIVSIMGPIFGGQCLRVLSSKLLAYMNYLYSMFPDIEELNPAVVLDFDRVPDTYKECFFAPNRAPSSEERELFGDLNLMDRSEYGDRLNANLTCPAPPVSEAQRQMAAASSANLTRQIEEKEAEFAAANASYRATLNAIRRNRNVSANEWNNSKVENILGADEYLNADNYAIQQLVNPELLAAAEAARSRPLILRSQIAQLTQLRTRALEREGAAGGKRRLTKRRKLLRKKRSKTRRN